jgi:formamidopyrimidine-DNA glycosylase
MLHKRRGSIKSFLLNQSALAGIGNAYVHDILWYAGLHPLRKIESLNEQNIKRLAKAIQQGLKPSIKKGGAFYEVDLYGQKGGFNMRHVKIGYKEGKPCPSCKTKIKKIKTGSTSTFICPHCQKV